MVLLVSPRGHGRPAPDAQGPRPGAHPEVAGDRTGHHQPPLRRIRCDDFVVLPDGFVTTRLFVRYVLTGDDFVTLHDCLSLLACLFTTC